MTYSISVFLDLNEAIDTLNHSILLDKLEAHEVRATANKGLERYLTNRKHFLGVLCQASDWAIATPRTPQDSVLGPLFFLIYINDIAKAFTFSQVYPFADDTNITSVFLSSASSQSDYSNKCDWLLFNKLSVKVEKTSLVIFNRKSTASILQVDIIESFLNTNGFCKYMGVFVGGNLRFCEHITYKRFKTANQSGVISKMSNYVRQSALLKQSFL